MFAPNPEQRAAVEHDDRPLLVLAGAGTGKTATLAARVGSILRLGVPPERVCLLTFSRRAAAEMLVRAGQLADPALAGRVVGGTFHSVSQRLLHHHGQLIGLGPGFSVLDASDATELIGMVRHDLGLASGRGRRFPRKETLASILSHVTNAQVKLSHVVAHSYPWCADHLAAMREVFTAYTERKRATQVCDFDDLLLLVRALGSTEVGASVLAGLFDHVLVDEYQDVNGLQADLVNLLRPSGQGLTAVGDDAQAIYGFRAASTQALLDLPQRYRGTVVVRLEHNYRSTPPILAVANQVMAEDPAGARKTLWSERRGRQRPLLRTCADEATEAEAVCDAVLAHREGGVALRDQAVLFRAGHHATALEMALSRRQIPYVKYGGLRFLEAAHVKDLLALLRILDNPFDELAWFRTLQLLEGVGAATARRVMGQLGLVPTSAVSATPKAPGSSPAPGLGDGARPASADPGATTPLALLLAAAPRVPETAVDELNGLRSALGHCTGHGTGPRPGTDAVSGTVGGSGAGGAPPAGAQVDRLRRWLEPIVRRRYRAPAARIEDLTRLAEQAAAAPSRGRFVADLTLDPPVSTGDHAGPSALDDDWLVLSTVHSAKGGEWAVVHVIHASDGSFPSDLATGDAEALAEERRLFYVAVTRARDALEVSAPVRYHHHRHRLDDRHGFALLSRFLSPTVQDLMDVTHAGPGAGVDREAPSEAPSEPGPSVAGGGVAAVDAMLADLWS